MVNDIIGVLPMRKKWYNNPVVQFNIINSLKERETTLLNTLTRKQPIRKIKIHNTGYLNVYLKKFNFFLRFYNIYFSLIRFYNMPQFSYNFKVRSEATGAFCDELEEEFKSGIQKYMIGYDFFTDIDSASIEKIGDAWSHADAIKGSMDKFRVPYVLKFSACKGFHITIDSDYFMPMATIKQKYDTAMMINEALNKKYSCVDLQGVKSYSRVMKCDYNLDVASGLIALPLSDEQFNNFHPNDMKMENVLKLNLYNRGRLERQKSLSTSEKIKNVNDFIGYINDSKN